MMDSPAPAHPSLHGAGHATANGTTPGFSTNKRPVPGPRALPLLGWRGNAVVGLRDPVVQMINWQQTYGDIMALSQEKDAPVLLFSAEYNHQLLTNPDLFYSLDVNSAASPIRMPAGSSASRLLSGIAGMNGEKHHTQRRMLMPGFHRKRVDMLRDSLVERTEEHLAGWQVGQRIDLVHEMVELSLSLAVSSLLGLNPGDEGRHVRELLHVWGKHGLSAVVALLPLDLPGIPYHRFLRLSEQLEAEFRTIVARKRASGADGGDALAMLINAQAEDGAWLSESDLLGHLTTFFTAGHETGASALTWILFLLAQHPDITADLMDELDGKLHGGAPTLDQLRELPLLENVISEGLRMFPPGMWMLRTANAPFALGPHELPAGTQLIYTPAVTHRRPDIYPEPNKFNPRRWENFTPGTYEYLPFGAGPRRCLGATLALMELRLIVPMVLQRFRLEVPPGTRVNRGGTALSIIKGGLPVMLRPRDGRYSAAPVRGNIRALVDFPTQA